MMPPRSKVKPRKFKPDGLSEMFRLDVDKQILKWLNVVLFCVDRTRLAFYFVPKIFSKEKEALKL